MGQRNFPDSAQRFALRRLPPGFDGLFRKLPADYVDAGKFADLLKNLQKSCTQKHTRVPLPLHCATQCGKYCTGNRQTRGAAVRCNWERDGPPFFPTHNRRLCRPPQCATYSSTVTIRGRCVSLDCARSYLSHGAVRPTWEPDWFVRPPKYLSLAPVPKVLSLHQYPPICRSIGVADPILLREQPTGDPSSQKSER